MSPKDLEIGEVITGTGRDKVDKCIEDALEAHRPCALRDRRNAVYTLKATDFSLCGIMQPGYIYAVTSDDDQQFHDLAWIGEMQKALLKQKCPQYQHVKKYPDWSDEFVEDCCGKYWSGQASDTPTWEALLKTCLVVEKLSDQPVDPATTKGGWSEKG